MKEIAVRVIRGSLESHLRKGQKNEGAFGEVLGGACGGGGGGGVVDGWCGVLMIEEG